MFMKYYKSTTGTLKVPAVMQVFESFEYATLYYSKYMFTALWAFIFFLANFFAVRSLTHNRQLTRLVVYAYIAICVTAAISMVYGSFVKNRLQDDEYTLSRWLLGIAQSPIICLILLASEKLYYKTTANDQKG
jgi:hypothetical protein